MNALDKADELQLTLDAIDAAWQDAYGAADKSATPTAARNRVTLLAKDVKCGADNFRVANAAYVKADAELRALQSSIEEAEGRCCPEDVGFEEWIGVLRKRDNVVAHTHLQEIVSLLLQTTVPIGPMRDRTDYPVELQRAIDFLHGRVDQSAGASRIDGLLLGVECLLVRCLRHGLLRAEVEAMLRDVAAARTRPSAPAPIIRAMRACQRHEGIPFTFTAYAGTVATYCPHCEAESASPDRTADAA